MAHLTRNRHGPRRVALEDANADVTDPTIRIAPLTDPFVEKEEKAVAVDRKHNKSNKGNRAQEVDDDSGSDSDSDQARPQSPLTRGAIMFLGFFAVFQVMALLARVGLSEGVPQLRNFMYLTGQHPLIPVHLPEQQLVTHMALAFMPSKLFNRDENDIEDGIDGWPLFTTIEATRALVSPSTKLLVAIGGWGDTAGFAQAARTASGRQRFARNVAVMVEVTGADGVDIDWEYPGGNGEDYKQVPNSQKAWEIGAYPLLLAEIREALGPDKFITAAVPGKPDDMMAFTSATVPDIMESVDFLNVMTYDLMNRRDTLVKHHTGVADSLTAVDTYIAAGCPPENINVGLAYYVKYFRTEHDSCVEQVHKTGSAVGCPTLLMEDPETGADLGRTGGFSWHDGVPEDPELAESFARALEHGFYTEAGGGGYGYWDDKADLWWSFDTEETVVRHKIVEVLQARRLGGVFAWGLGEDGPVFSRFTETSRAWKLIRDRGWDTEVVDAEPAVDVDVGAGDREKKKSSCRNGWDSRAVTRDEL